MSRSLRGRGTKPGHSTTRSPVVGLLDRGRQVEAPGGLASKDSRYTGIAAKGSVLRLGDHGKGEEAQAGAHPVNSLKGFSAYFPDAPNFVARTLHYPLPGLLHFCPCLAIHSTLPCP